MNKAFIILLFFEACKATVDLESVISTKQNYINQMNATISELRSIKKKLDSELKESKYANTAGNTASIAGTFLLYTPFFYVGLVTLGAGAVIGSNFNEDFIEGEQIKKLENLIEREELAEKHILKHYLKY